MKAYLLLTAIIFGLVTFYGISQSKDSGDTVMCVLFAALSVWGFYLAFNL